MYTIYLIYNGNKRQIASKYSYESRREWRIEMSLLPYDIVDEDEHNAWFDYGDL